MKILDRLPYSAEHRTIMVRGEPVQVRPYQIVIWISVSIARLHEWDPRTPAFPAILDPGNNFNFSVFQSQLVRWAGIQPALLKFLGRIKEGGKHYPRHAADVWLHRNKRGSHDLRPDQTPYRLVLRRGLALYPDVPDRVPPLPLLGLRALTENQLHTLIDGERREVSAHTPSRTASLLRMLRLPPF